MPKFYEIDSEGNTVQMSKNNLVEDYIKFSDYLILENRFNKLKSFIKKASLVKRPRLESDYDE